jgi:hypothetical protein
MKIPPESVVIYDTEIIATEKSAPNMWNDVGGVPLHVIQIGAMKIALDEELAVTDSFSALVTPRDLQGCVLRLPDYIVNLTGITQNRMDEEGHALGEVMRDFAKFIEGQNAFSWGRQFDTCALFMPMVNHGLTAEISLFDPKRFGDLREIFVKTDIPAERMSNNTESGKPLPPDSIISSGRVAKFFGVEPEGHKEHDAIHDVASLIAALRHVWKCGTITAADFAFEKCWST